MPDDKKAKGTGSTSDENPKLHFMKVMWANAGCPTGDAESLASALGITPSGLSSRIFRLKQELKKEGLLDDKGTAGASAALKKSKAKATGGAKEGKKKKGKRAASDEDDDGVDRDAKKVKTETEDDNELDS